MNKYIAELFAELLALIHFLALGAFGWYVYQAKPWHGPKEEWIFTLLIFAGYIAFTGLMSTFVSINENLTEIRSLAASVKEELEEVKDTFSNAHSSLEEITDIARSTSLDIEAINDKTRELRDQLVFEFNGVTSGLSDSALTLANSVTSLNNLLNQDWFRKAFLK